MRLTASRKVRVGGAGSGPAPKLGFGAIFGVVVGAVLLSACAFDGDTLNPFKRKTSWYSYLQAEDLRAACVPGQLDGQGDSMRLVYNAIHTEQIRTYDITMAFAADGALSSDTSAEPAAMSMATRVLGPSNLSKLSEGILGPWLGDTATTTLRGENVDRLWAALENSGAFDPAPRGLNLVSEKFFWLTAVCRGGTFSYNAYVWPTDRFEQTQFDDLLFSWDMTGVPVNEPRAATMFDIYGDASPTRKTGPYYQLTIGENGLQGW